MLRRSGKRRAARLRRSHTATKVPRWRRALAQLHAQIAIQASAVACRRRVRVEQGDALRRQPHEDGQRGEGARGRGRGRSGNQRRPRASGFKRGRVRPGLHKLHEVDRLRGGSAVFVGIRGVRRTRASEAARAEVSLAGHDRRRGRQQPHAAAGRNSLRRAVSGWAGEWRVSVEHTHAAGCAEGHVLASDDAGAAAAPTRGWGRLAAMARDATLNSCGGRVWRPHVASIF